MPHLLRRGRTSEPTGAPPSGARTKVPKSTRRWQLDPTFLGFVDHAIDRAGGISRPLDLEGARAGRLFNLVSVLGATGGIDGDVAEVGVFTGVASLLLCQYLRLDDDGFRGQGYHMFDSFEGLSELVDADAVDGQIEGTSPRSAGMFAATLESVQKAMAEFPDITFHKGWIPDCFDARADRPYRFVHIDVDIYQPTLDSLRYFVPRLSPGGIVVLDDHGAARWPGVAKATTEFVAEHGGRAIELSAGQALYLPAG